MPYVIGAVLGMVWIWFWLRGHWFAAVLSMPLMILIGFFIQQVQVTPANPATLGGGLMVLMGSPLLAWVPFFVRRQVEKNHNGKSLSLTLR